MIIKVLRLLDSESNETEILEEIEVNGLDVSSIRPVRDKVGTLFTIEDLKDLTKQVQPAYEPDEQDSYYSQSVRAWVDGNPSEIDIPHHIGFKALVTSVLQKYDAQSELRIQIG